MSFVPHKPTSEKVRCTECGRVGHQTNGTGWQSICARGHAPCPECGHINSVGPDGSPRRCRGGGARNRHG